MPDYGKEFKSLCDQLSAIGKPVEESDKSYWFLRSFGPNFANFVDTRMSKTLVPPFKDLLHQAIQFDLMKKAIEGSAPAPMAFVTLNNNNGRIHTSGQ